MGKKSSSNSTSLSVFNPKYYFKKPQQLVLVIFGFISLVLLVSDRQNLTREHQEEVLRLNEELAQLKLQLEDFNVKVQWSAGLDSADISKDDDDDPVSVERREKVKEAMLHAWTSYEKYAWGHDELQVCFLSFLFCFLIAETYWVFSALYYDFLIKFKTFSI
jgi:mannosyl-oligosaccharide alpha-1,2-mannosidase